MSRLTWPVVARSASVVSVAVVTALLPVGLAAVPAGAAKAAAPGYAGYVISGGPPGSVTSVKATVELPSPSFDCKKKSDVVIVSASITDSVSQNSSGPLVWLECSTTKVAQYRIQFIPAGYYSAPTLTLNAGDF